MCVRLMVDLTQQFLSYEQITQDAGQYHDENDLQDDARAGQAITDLSQGTGEGFSHAVWSLYPGK